MGTKVSKIVKSPLQKSSNKQKIDNVKNLKKTQNNNVPSSSPPSKKDLEDINFKSMLKEISKSIETQKTQPIYNTERIAEVKKIISDQKKVLQKQRISTIHLKAILSDKDLNDTNLTPDKKKTLIQNLAKK